MGLRLANDDNNTNLNQQNRETSMERDPWEPDNSGMKMKDSLELDNNGIKIRDPWEPDNSSMKIKDPWEPDNSSMKMKDPWEPDNSNMRMKDSLELENSSMKMKDPWEPEQKQNVNENPWDFNGYSEPGRTISIANDTGRYINSGQQDIGNNMPDLFKYVVYAGFVIDVLLIIWVCTSGKIHLYANLKSVSWIFSAVNLFCIVDAVHLNRNGGQKWSLVAWAWLLSILYPMKRNKHVEGSAGIGALITIALVIGYASLVAQAFSTVLIYGDLVYVEDKATRDIVEELYGQTGNNGVTLGSRLEDNLFPENVQIETKDSQTVILLTGNGRHYVDNDGAMVELQQKSSPTTLAFTKNSSGVYELTGAVFLNRTLSYQYLEFYKSNVLFE